MVRTAALVLAAAALFASSAAHTPADSGFHAFEKRASTATVITTCKQPKTWAVTLDDGPYDYQPQLRSLAKKYGAKLSMFVNGNNWRCIYDKAEELQKSFKAGHMIGNHLWTHPDAVTLNETAFKSEVRQVEVAMKKILGVTPATFRYPFGSYNAQTNKWLKDLGYPTAIDWDTDSKDADGASVASQKKVYDKSIANGKPHISLNHETHLSTVTGSLPYLMRRLAAKNYKMVTVAECLGVKPYRSNTGKLGTRDSTWHC